jgi:hypothetical protein
MSLFGPGAAEQVANRNARLRRRPLQGGSELPPHLDKILPRLPFAGLRRLNVRKVRLRLCECRTTRIMPLHALSSEGPEVSGLGGMS